MLEMYKFFSLKSHAMYYLLCILKSNKNIIYMYISKIDVKSMILIPGVLYGQNIFVVDVCEIFRWICEGEVGLPCSDRGKGCYQDHGQTLAWCKCCYQIWKL